MERWVAVVSWQDDEWCHNISHVCFEAESEAHALVHVRDNWDQGTRLGVVVFTAAEFRSMAAALCGDQSAEPGLN